MGSPCACYLFRVFHDLYSALSLWLFLRLSLSLCLGLCSYMLPFLYLLSGFSLSQFSVPGSLDFGPVSLCPMADYQVTVRIGACALEPCYQVVALRPGPWTWMPRFVLVWLVPVIVLRVLWSCTGLDDCTGPGPLVPVRTGTGMAGTDRYRRTARRTVQMTDVQSQTDGRTETDGCMDGHTMTDGRTDEKM